MQYKNALPECNPYLWRSLSSPFHPIFPRTLAMMKQLLLQFSVVLIWEGWTFWLQFTNAFTKWSLPANWFWVKTIHCFHMTTCLLHMTRLSADSTTSINLFVFELCAPDYFVSGISWWPLNLIVFSLATPTLNILPIRFDLGPISQSCLAENTAWQIYLLSKIRWLRYIRRLRCYYWGLSVVL